VVARARGLVSHTRKAAAVHATGGFVEELQGGGVNCSGDLVDQGNGFVSLRVFRAGGGRSVRQDRGGGAGSGKGCVSGVAPPSERFAAAEPLCMSPIHNSCKTQHLRLSLAR